MTNNQIEINAHDYALLIDDIKNLNEVIKGLKEDWSALSSYVDQKIENNPSNSQYKNIRHAMDYIKGGIVDED
ncbi:hypothetical protein [Staphylococcus simulans]|uniref:hypothetical protein n=1 Tax=Staphylococcus simulans TaxID=1286 RepID=UPI0018EE5DCD|nr:hypothetical protein [Staphylococcus simulans]